jgi:hypothetical protein
VGGGRCPWPCLPRREGPHADWTKSEGEAMATKKPRPPVMAVRVPLRPGYVHRPGMTTQDRLHEIELMRQRVNDYAEFMCRVDGLTGTSAEAKEKAVTAFHERMVALEQQLGRIQEELRLG